ncbi:MAG: SIR2 family protein [Desulfobacteraceae bacterium]|nr:SIR2 family protein [Desulfobacteraceae bacterium]
MSQPRIFISYSHQDAVWLPRLETQLGVLQQEGLMRAWSDRDLHPGDDWPQDLLAAINAADIAILLVSANFLNSGFIRQKELPLLLERKRQGKVRILPLVLTPCLWDVVKSFKDLEVRPKGRTVVQGNDAEQFDDFYGIAHEVVRLLTEGPGKKIEDGPPGVGGEPGAPKLVPRENRYAVLEVRFTHREWDFYGVELSFTHSGSSSHVDALRYSVPLDVKNLISVDNYAQYAARLRSLIFPETFQQDLIQKASNLARELEIPLCLRIAISGCARELDCLPWEVLTLGNRSENDLSFESTCLVRYADSDVRSWRQIQHRPKGHPKAVVVAGLTDFFDSSVPPAGYPDLAAEDAGLAAEVLEKCKIEVTGVHGYLTPEALNAKLSETGADMVYLCVDLVENSGVVDPAAPNRWTQLARNLPASESLKGLDQLPRLFVLSPIRRDANSAPSAPPPECWLPVLREGFELAQAGVLGVLTNQAPMDRGEWHSFLSTFLLNLDPLGRMDGALHASRMGMKPGGRQWIPVLISCLRTTRIWYVPRFTDESKSAFTWETLLSKIKKGKCTPILGPGLNSTVSRVRTKMALSLAETYHYPMAFHERVSLPQVAQYVSSVYGSDHFCNKYEDILREFVLSHFAPLLESRPQPEMLDRILQEIGEKVLAQNLEEPHNILASLPFPIYLTAGLNPFLTCALRRAPGKTPCEEVLGLEERQRKQVDFDPAPEKPLVYHLFGRLSELRNCVLTEDDYFDFLIHFWKEKGNIPTVVLTALTDSSLLFLGFKMHHWDFRVLFRTFLAQEGHQLRGGQMHIAVQIDPDDDQIVEPERARQYLENYFAKFSGANINVYWGSAEDFLKELKNHWDGRGGI